MKLTITKKHMFNIPAYVNILYIKLEECGVYHTSYSSPV